jgi:hypothetical protein
MVRIFILSFAMLFIQLLVAQENTNLVQFSGMVLDGSDRNLVPVPFANILVKDKSRGTYTDYQGFFTIVVEKGDVIVFSAIGYKTVEYTIDKDLKDNRYSLVQLMTQDTFNLPETVVFPWPSREHFKIEFLAMNVDNELSNRANENLAEEALAKMRNEVSYDGNENADFYLRQQTKNYYYIGQRPPMNIFNPVAWKKFFDAWKNGDFKNKKDN